MVIIISLKVPKSLLILFSGHKRSGDSSSSSSSLAKKQKRTPKRANTIAKNEKNGTGMGSEEIHAVPSVAHVWLRVGEFPYTNSSSFNP